MIIKKTPWAITTHSAFAVVADSILPARRFVNTLFMKFSSFAFWLMEMAIAAGIFGQDAKPQQMPDFLRKIPEKRLDNRAAILYTNSA
jgi:hypothetical protein